jgi:DNA-binding NarL/FixJ family response regulator
MGPSQDSAPCNAGRASGVWIIGRDSVQLRLLAEMISERLGCRCDVRAPIDLEGSPLPPSALLLLDVECLPSRQIAAFARALLTGSPQSRLAVFNIDDLESLQPIVQLPGVRGTFTRDVSQEQLLKGIKAVLAGEYWLPRKVLSAYLESTRTRRGLSGTNGVALTPKEAETLRLLVSGNSNNDIAGHLKVSTHTVKTHLYNLFRKLKVSNRVQAVHWAMNHGEHIDREAR